MEQTEATTTVRPFWGRVTLIESTVDEFQRDSGLIVPLHHEEDAGVRRGVVVAVDYSWGESAPQMRSAAEQIKPGRVVYFRKGILVRDVLVVEIADILAYEDEGE